MAAALPESDFKKAVEFLLHEHAGSMSADRLSEYKRILNNMTLESMHAAIAGPDGLEKEVASAVSDFMKRQKEQKERNRLSSLSFLSPSRPRLPDTSLILPFEEISSEGYMIKFEKSGDDMRLTFQIPDKPSKSHIFKEGAYFLSESQKVISKDGKTHMTIFRPMFGMNPSISMNESSVITNYSIPIPLYTQFIAKLNAKTGGRRRTIRKTKKAKAAQHRRSRRGRLG